VSILTALEEFDLELVEQPVAADDLEGLAQVAESVAIPVAADEAVTSLEAARTVLEARAVEILVVKPTVVGGLSESKRIVEAAHAFGAEAYVTTNLDAGVATVAALHLAATLPKHARACGLATAGLLEHDLLSLDLPVEGGDMSLPEGSGLGVELDETALQRYEAGPEEST
jgi:L-alanine-DL-glutamate epimerase-like enolase superfamily enzyme